MNEIPYRIVRSKRKSLGLQISRELEVIVRAPHYVPESVIDGFVRKHEAWITSKLDARRNTITIHSTLTEEELLDLTRRAEVIIPDRVTYFAEQMELWPTVVKITRTQSKFGSCNKDDKLSFSCRLMLYPPEAVDYVVVHELAHIRHKNHGAGFWTLVETYLPDYRQRIKLLRV